MNGFLIVPGTVCLLAHISPFTAIRWGPEKPLLTTPELQLSEACALVHSLPKWRVADTVRLFSHHSLKVIAVIVIFA